jgi:Putative homoserine kinase type II (protein kinase fold)
MNEFDAGQPSELSHAESLLDLNEVMQAFGIVQWENLGPIESLHSENQGIRVSIAGQEYILRERPQGPGEADLRFRYAFQQHLQQEGIPLPVFHLTPAGEPTVKIGEDYFELQQQIGGELFSTASPHSLEWVAAAASMLGRIHQASQRYQGVPYRWPSEVHMGAMVHGYLSMARTRADESQLPVALTAGLSEWVERWEAALPAAMVALGAHQHLPEFHIHGDYHALNLRFGPFGVSAVTGLETVHWEKRIFEVATALFYFSGLAWLPGSDVTSPLLKRGFDPERMRTFLHAYGEYCPPASGEAELLVDALALVSPLVILNGPLEDLLYTEREPEEIELDPLLESLAWAAALPAWLGRVRRSIVDMWS